MPALKVGIDPPKIRQGDAARLMVHHLSLAKAYFEATPPTQHQALAEIADVFADDDLGLTAARQWFISLTDAYDALDK